MNRRQGCSIAFLVCVGLSVLLLGLGPLYPPRLLFSQFGPDNDWGSGVREKLPPSPPLSIPEWVREYGLQEAMPSVATEPEIFGLVGEPIDHDRNRNADTFVVLTTGYPRETSGQRICYHLTADEWHAVSVPTRLDLREVAFCCDGEDAVILASRWNPWYPYSENYPRYRASQTDSELRCQYAIYCLDPKTHRIRFLFPGHELRSSPDFRRVAYLTSLNDACPRYHTIWVYDIRSEQPTPVLSFWIAASASVWSVDYEWSADSQALRITGEADGFARRGPRRTRKVDMVYIAETGELYDLAQ